MADETFGVGKIVEYTEHGMSKAQAAILRVEMAGWIDGLAPWQVIAHLSFKPRPAFQSGRKFYSERVQQVAPPVGTSHVAAAESFERLMRRSHPDTDYFYATESNPGLIAGAHIHTVLHRPLKIYCKAWWEEWFELYGRNRFELIKSKDDVVSYAAKYVTKERSWWNVKLAHMPAWSTKSENLLL